MKPLEHLSVRNLALLLSQTDAFSRCKVSIIHTYCDVECLHLLAVRNILFNENNDQIK